MAQFESGVLLFLFKQMIWRLVIWLLHCWRLNNHDGHVRAADDGSCASIRLDGDRHATSGDETLCLSIRLVYSPGSSITASAAAATNTPLLLRPAMTSPPPLLPTHRDTQNSQHFHSHALWRLELKCPSADIISAWMMQRDTGGPAGAGQ